VQTENHICKRISIKCIMGVNGVMIRNVSTNALFGVPMLEIELKLMEQYATEYLVRLKEDR